MSSDGPAAAAKRNVEAKTQAAEGTKPRIKAVKPKPTLPKFIRAPLTIFSILMLLLAWILLWCIQTVAIILTYPFTTLAQRQDICGHIHRKVNYLFVVLLNPLWWSTVIKGMPNLKGKKKVIVMMNHLSNSDPWFAIRPMGVGIDCKWICKGSLAKVPFGGWGLVNAGDLFVKFTDAKDGWGTEKGSVSGMMNEAKGLLNRGQPIAVFPEGVRSFNPDGPLGEFKLGFFMLAVEEEATIVPIAFSGAETAWPRGDWMFDFSWVYSSCGEPIDAAGHTPESLRDKVWNTVSELRDSHPDRQALLKRKQKGE